MAIRRLLKPALLAAALAGASPLAAQAATPTGNVSIAMSGAGPISQGATRSFTLTGANHGPTTVALGLTITAIMPAGLAPVSGGSAMWGCSVSAQTIGCTYAGGPLSPGTAFPPFTIVARGVTLGPYQQCASISLPGGDNSPGNNNACVTGQVVLARNLGLAQSGGGTVNWGSQVVLTLSPANLGPAAAVPGGAVVMDTLPAGLTPVGFTAPGWNCGFVGQALTCAYTGPSIASGPLPPITVRATASGEGLFSNCASIVSNGATDPVPANDRSCVQVNIRPRSR